MLSLTPNGELVDVPIINGYPTPLGVPRHRQWNYLLAPVTPIEDLRRGNLPTWVRDERPDLRRIWKCRPEN